MPRAAIPVRWRVAGGRGRRMSVKLGAAVPSRREPHPRLFVCWIARAFRHGFALDRAGQKQVRRVHERPLDCVKTLPPRTANTPSQRAANAEPCVRFQTYFVRRPVTRTESGCDEPCAEEKSGTAARDRAAAAVLRATQAPSRGWDRAVEARREKGRRAAKAGSRNRMIHAMPAGF